MADYSALNLSYDRPKVSTPTILSNYNNFEFDEYYFLLLCFVYNSKRKGLNLSHNNVALLGLIYILSNKGKLTLKTGQISLITGWSSVSITNHINALKRACLLVGDLSGFVMTNEGILFVRGLKTQLRQRKMKLKKMVESMGKD